ncbi:hypothetical protein [Phycicoccus avicenniae]|uniref:hypothetical protein n=1 Tax=Phycicoccus avicenniae TaxID=2828860 RepID=UPI003D2E11F0
MDVTATRRWLPATLLGLAVALAFAGLVVSRRPDWPAAVGLTVFTLTTWPVVTVGLQMLWFDRARTDREVAQGEMSVERTWFQEAAATAFVTLIGGLLFLDGVGDALDVGWMSPVGLPHALVLGLGTFGLSYLWLRARGR